MSKVLIVGISIISVILIFVWKFNQNKSALNQQAIDCISFVQQGIDLTGKGKNNCTSPELIPNR